MQAEQNADATAAAAAAAAEKARSRLSRCGQCENCNRRDCGKCVNCADKPKFGGPGIKKQACVVRKCLNMQTREETDATGVEDAQARKRVKQGPPPPALTINTSLSFTADEVDLGGDGGKGSRSTSDENISDSVAGDIDTDDTMNADGSSPRKELAKESAWAGNTELLIDYLVRRKGRTEGWKRLRETEVEEGKSVEIGDWPWADKCALEEEFISMNDRHRRESGPPNLNVLVH